VIRQGLIKGLIRLLFFKKTIKDCLKFQQQTDGGIRLYLSGKEAQQGVEVVVKHVWFQGRGKFLSFGELLHMLLELSGAFAKLPGR
jgi:hypothetical protein